MIRNQLITSLFTAAILVCSSGSAHAVSRNCTAEEKSQADRQLEVIAADQRLQGNLSEYHAPFGLPVALLAGNEQVLYQGGYIMAHDPDLKTSLWVSYQINGQDVANAQGKDRVECFRMDPRLKRGTKASTTDYAEPVYDRGHMANDADLKDNLIEQINSYVMSNMSPQHCRFNRGIWLSMESLTRRWAGRYGPILVTTGAIFDRDGVDGRDPDDLAQRMQSNNGKTRVGVPSHYYKTFLRREGDGLEAISFIFKNDNSHHGVVWEDVRPSVSNAISSIEEIEAHASLKLYPDLQQPVRESRAGEKWDFSSNDGNFEATCD
ncbi:MAG: DNA/RNA non-specific endonuclease [Thalassospira sp.]|uniref:DNA/RNA non-specific endonuclease n=1 Tax=Thalassospira sp. TaxID=1912094 RepID=UPI0032EEC767